MTSPNSNVQLKDAFGDAFTAPTYDFGVSSEPVQAPASVPTDANGNQLFNKSNPGTHGVADTVVSASFTRPNNTTAYSLGNLVANDTGPSGVVPMSLPVSLAVAATSHCQRARLTKNGPGSGNAIFRAHLYKTSPSPVNGDGGAWLTNQALGYLGSFTFDMTGEDVRSFTDGIKVIAVPDVGSYQIIDPGAALSVIYALLEVRAAYVPTANEVFTLALELTQN